MVEASDLDLIHSKHKAISTLFPYITHLGQGRQQGIAEIFSHAARASNFLESMWPHLKPYMAALLKKPIHSSLDWIGIDWESVNIKSNQQINNMENLSKCCWG